MAAISVVTFGSTTNNNTKSKVLQNSNRDVIIIRKSDKTVNKKLKKEPGQRERVSHPTPIAVARRNARERNRVKQVNNGFAMLRQHIPAEIAAAFEHQTNNGKGAGIKKLSKVETLRMAVEYIRSLEEILSASSSDDSDNMNGNSSVTSSSSLISFPSPTLSTSSAQTFIYSNSVDIVDESHSPEHFHQYVRIPGTHTYHAISTNKFPCEDEENIQPMVDDITSNNRDAFIGSPLPDMVFDDNQMFNSNLSPYSDDSSLSPNQFSNSNNIPILPPIVFIKSRHLLPEDTLLSPTNQQFGPLNSKLLSPNNVSQYSNLTSVITNSNDLTSASIFCSPDNICPAIKTEVADEVDLNLGDGVVKTEEMIDVMDWWETNQRLNHDD